MRLAGKRALITAAASGMGAAGAGLFAREGAQVALFDRDGEALAGVVERIRAEGGVAAGYTVDLTDREATLAAVTAAETWLGGIDVLWNHAGMPAPSDISALDVDRYDVSLDLNLTAAVTVSGAVLPAMCARGAGSIIFTSSTSGLVGSALSPLYSAFKSAVIGLVKGLAVRYAAQHVRVNALCPGPVATPMLFDGFLPGDGRFTREENLARVVAVVPMGRMAEPIEVAYAALFLASDESSFVTGIALPIDGGQTAR